MRWRSKRPTRYVVGFGALAALVLAWWWPGLNGQDSQTDVMVVASPSMTGSSDVIVRRLREEGFTTQWSPTDVVDCSLPVPTTTRWEILVIGLPDAGSCEADVVLEQLAQLSSTFPKRRIVVVVSWRDPQGTESFDETALGSEVELVDPRRMIGGSDDALMCLWWDDCPASGRVVTVSGSTLTSAGQQRLARSIVAGVL